MSLLVASISCSLPPHTTKNKIGSMFTIDYAVFTATISCKFYVELLFMSMVKGGSVYDVGQIVKGL